MQSTPFSQLILVKNRDFLYILLDQKRLPIGCSFTYTLTGLPESFEVDGWVVKVSSQSRDILCKKTSSVQVGSDFRRHPATFDNPALSSL